MVPATMICGVGACDGSGSTIPVARDLASRLGVRLEILHVAGRADSGERDSVRRQLGLPADAELHLDVGPVARRLVEAAGRAQLLIIGAGRASRLRRALGGGVATAVARSCAAPVLIVPSTPSLRPVISAGGIICGVRDRDDIAPARVAARLARQLDSTLTLAHMPVVPPPVAVPGDPGLLMTATGSEVLAEAVPRLFADVEAALPAQCPAINELSLPAGPPGQGLARAATSAHAGLIVLGAPRHSAMTGTLTGSAAWQMLGCPPAPLLLCPR